MLYENDQEDRVMRVGRACCIYSMPGGDTLKSVLPRLDEATDPRANTTIHIAVSMPESGPESKNCE